MTRRGRRALLVGGALAAVLLAAVPPPGGSAQAQPAQDEPDIDLQVDDLTGLMAQDEEFEADLAIANRRSSDVEDLRVVGTLHTAVTSRFALQQAVDEGELGSVVDGFAESVDRLAGGGRTRVAMRRGADELGFTGPDQAGVYPLRFRLLRDGDVVDQVRTALVFTPAQIDQPVRAAFVLPLDGPPLVGADGAVNDSRLQEHLGSTGRARQLVEALATRNPFPVTVAANGMLLDHAARAVLDENGETAQQATAFLDRLRALTGRRQVNTLAMPYGRADLVALVRGGMPEEALRHVREGDDVVARHTGTSPASEVVWPPDGLDADTLDTLVDAGVDTVMLEEAYLSVPQRHQLSPSPVRELRVPDEGTITALVPDPWLSDVLANERLAENHGAAVAAQRVLAETAAAYFEQPFTEDARGLLLAPPQAWDPPRELVGRLADALTAAPWLRPVTVSELGREIEATEPPVSLDYPDDARERELPSDYVGRLRHARHLLGGLSRVLPADPQVASRFDSLVRMAASVHYRRHWSTDTYSAFPTPLSEGLAALNRVRDTAQDVYSSVEVVEGPRVLIDDEGKIPVTLANESRVPLRLQVRLLTGRFSFPDSGEQVVTLEAGEQRTLTFRARAITPGAQSPIGVVVEDPEGATRLAEGRVVVRSTGVSIAALVATVGAGLFLAIWSVRQVTRRRRAARAPEAATDREVQPVPPEPTVAAPEG